jgi:hypothetical protein
VWWYLCVIRAPSSGARWDTLRSLALAEFGVFWLDKDERSVNGHAKLSKPRINTTNE